MSGGISYWERRAIRRIEHRQFLIERGLDCRSLSRALILSLDPKLFVAFSIIGLFGWAFARNPTDEVMIGALIAAFAGAWGYYLGSSNTASRANDRADNATQLTHEVMRRLPSPPSQLPNGGGTETMDVLSDEEKAEIERLIAENDLAALQALAVDLAEAAGKTDPREIATLIVKARRA